MSPDKYSADDENAIKVMLGRLFNRAKRSGYTYRQLARVLNAKSHVTVYRWFHGISTPSKSHLTHIKMFLGYSK